MPEPLATTKRKFHKLLDNLTKHANATVTISEPRKDLTAREQLLLASERVNKRQRILDTTPTSSRSPSIRSLASVRQTTRAPPGTQQTLPAFSPYSHDTFLQRLQTFSSVSRWHPKPGPINEVVWAKRGWQCVGVNTVACVGGCEQRVHVDLSRGQVNATNEGVDEDEGEEEDSLNEAYTERYKQEIIHGHGEQCLWRRASCKDDIYRLQVVRPAVWRPQLSGRYQTLRAVEQSVKNIHVTGLKDTASVDGVVELFNSDTREGASSQDSTPLEEPALQAKLASIAMHGWHASSESHADLLQCHACFQRVGLWMYQPDYHRKSGSLAESDEGLGSSTTTTTTLDLLDMHREYCPWRNGDSQCASGSLAGLNACEILSRVVQTYLRERRRAIAAEEHTSPVVDDADDDQTVRPADEGEEEAVVRLTREEVDQQDRERDGRLAKLKTLLSLKRPRKMAQTAA